MASLAYANQWQNGSSNEEGTKPRFTLIEGGLSNTNHSAKDSTTPMGLRSPHVPGEEEIRLSRPHPKHSGLTVFVVAILISVAICVVSMISSNIISDRIEASLVSVPSTEYTVCSGDSLWSIAETHPIEGHSASEVVTWMMELNNLNNGLLVAGQTILVPSQML